MANLKLELGGELAGMEKRWLDISSESFRCYQFRSGLVDPESVDLQFVTVTILDPQWLSVSESGGHKILDGMGISHYIPASWVHVYWEGDPHFVK